MNFTINKAYLECLDVNYDSLYLNRYADSLNVLNYIVDDTFKTPLKLYFNFIDVFNDDLTNERKEAILDNLKNNDPNLLNIILDIDSKIPDIIYNNQMLYFRNISEFISTAQNLFSLEEYIENQYPHSYLILISEIDLSPMGYDLIKNNIYIKKLY